MSSGDNRDDDSFVDNPVDDTVFSAARRVERIQRLMQLLAEPLRVLRKGTGDEFECRGGLPAIVVAAAHVFGRTPGDEGFVGVDEKTLPECFASDEHPEIHLVTLAECRLCGYQPAADLNVKQDDHAVFGMAGGTAHVTSIMHGALHLDDVFSGPLPRSHFESNIFPVGGLFDVERVKCGAARTGIDFGFDPRNADARQAHPFAPSDDGA